jgi:hypothetical protein
MPDLTATLVPPQFRFLIDENGFRVIGGKGSSTHFDDMYVELTNDLLNVAIVRESGFISAEVRSPAEPTSWLPLEFLRQLVLRRDPAEEVTFDSQAEFLRTHVATITDLLSEPKLAATTSDVISIGRERRKRLFPGSVREV